MFKFTDDLLSKRKSYFDSNDVAFAGISGGRTSGLMGCLLAPSIQLLFENTGREDTRTLDYLNELDLALKSYRKTSIVITWLEYRKPKVKADRPKNAQWAIVNYKTADRSGGPFEAFMEAMNEFREAKGAKPIAPYHHGRICTAQMKHKTAERYISSLGIDTYTMFVGLRGDELDRVYKLKKKLHKVKILHARWLMLVSLKKMYLTFGHNRRLTFKLRNTKVIAMAVF